MDPRRWAIKLLKSWILAPRRPIHCPEDSGTLKLTLSSDGPCSSQRHSSSRLPYYYCTDRRQPTPRRAQPPRRRRSRKPPSRSCEGLTFSRSGPIRPSSCGQPAQRGQLEWNTGPVADPSRAWQQRRRFVRSSATGIPDYYQHEATLHRTQSEHELSVRSSPRRRRSHARGHRSIPHRTPATGTGTVHLVAFGDSGNGSSSAGAAWRAPSSMPRRSTSRSMSGHRLQPRYLRAVRLVLFFPSIATGFVVIAVFPVNWEPRRYDGSATPYRTLFVLPRDGASAAFPNNAERFYSLDYGPVHFIALDTQAAFLSTARRQEQLAWLGRPAGSAASAPGGSLSFIVLPTVRGLSTDPTSRFVRRSARCSSIQRPDCLTGHEHSYERTVPWRESRRSRGRPLPSDTGGAGAAPYPVGRAHLPRSRAPSTLPADGPLADRRHARGCGTNGAVFDRFTLDLAQQQSDASPPQVSIVSPEAGAVLSGTATIEVSAADDARVEKVDLWVDGRSGRSTSPSRNVHRRHDRWPTARTRSRRAPSTSTAGGRPSRAVTVSNGASDATSFSTRRKPRCGPAPGGSHRYDRCGRTPSRTSRGRRGHNRSAARQPGALRRARGECHAGYELSAVAPAQGCRQLRL